MQKSNYQIDTPINAFVFDCDGTLSLIEGIEVLAEQNGVGERVHELTAYAMGEAGLNPDIYQERLALVRPSRQQAVDLAQHYFANRVPAIIEIIKILQALGKAVYVVSAGVNPAVKLFATMLGVPAENAFAVDLKFEQDGAYQDYDRAAHPAQDNGKRVIADQIRAQHESLIWIGDGMNDMVVKPDVKRFVGYGGAFYRPNIAKNSDYYIKCQSMTPLLALGLTANEVASLDVDAHKLYQEGLHLIEADEVEM
jgi:phosphoserine phosphatase